MLGSGLRRVVKALEPIDYAIIVMLIITAIGYSVERTELDSTDRIVTKELELCADSRGLISLSASNNSCFNNNTEEVGVTHPYKSKTTAYEW